MHHEPFQHLCVLSFHSNASARSLKEQETLLWRLSLEATRRSLSHLRHRGSHSHSLLDRDPGRALSFASRVPAPEMTKHCKQLNRAAFGREAMECVASNTPFLHRSSTFRLLEEASESLRDTGKWICEATGQVPKLGDGRVRQNPLPFNHTDHSVRRDVSPMSRSHFVSKHRALPENRIVMRPGKPGFAR